MELRNLDLPQLIVALDSLNDDANYIHIKDVREDVVYYCPCCKGIVKPRAYKDDKEYQVQPHFYHETGGCNEETYIHYICKNWLFEKGCKFLVSGIEYEVDNIDTEKTLHTSFGDYRPDIIVTTTIGKVYYFEIRTTNRKTELYAPKWDELGNDVVEVDTRYFINQKHKNDIPEFELIYSNGECFIKSYSRIDYEDTIAKRKLEWKRQDKLNYKMQWEKLDWFWCELQKYKENNLDKEFVIDRFSELTFEDMSFCMNILYKIKCINIYESCKNIIDQKFYEEISKLDIYPYENIFLCQESPRIFYIGFQICNIDNLYYWYHSFCIRKYIKYYDIELLNHIIKCCQMAKEKQYDLIELPRYMFIKQYKRQKVLIEKNTRFYLNERPCFYVDGYETPFNLNCYSFEYKFNTKDLRILHKDEHLQRIKNIKKEYELFLLTNFIINKINKCKNKCWHISIEKNYYGYSYYSLRLSFTLNNIQDYSYIYMKYVKSKMELYRQIKNEMKKIILKYYDGTFKYDYHGKRQEIRIMEVANGK